ncbi:MAG: 50S ribosomal protein L13 [Nitrospira sp.]|nr:50S ribosomal protein L13 [Nitrospira sp.]
MMKTYSIKASDIKREWHIIDASDEILGKLATQVAKLLSGKHKPLFARNMDVGDYVVIINAGKVRFTGNKMKQKMYYRHSQYPGGLRSEKLEELMEKYPERVIENAVKGMLPRNKLNAKMMKRLRIFTGADNPYGKPTTTIASVSDSKNN